jgi:hypothetical protein
MFDSVSSRFDIYVLRMLRTEPSLAFDAGNNAGLGRRSPPFRAVATERG